MKNVFFSIIIPVYNAEKYISRSIESVINQTFNNIEIIIIDDCSNDKSLSIVKKYAAENPKIKLIINKTNRGTFYTRIMAIHKARGQYILFLDSDDEIDCNTCKHIYNIVKNSKVDIIQYQTFYGKSLQTMRKHFSSKGKRFLVGNKCILFNFFSREISGNLCGKAFKKELFNDALKLINFYSNIHLNYHEDFIICFAFCCVAQTYISTTNGKYYYYSSTKSYQ